MSNAGNRDGGLFVALPHAVINSAAYRGLSHTARSLLIDIATQLSPRGENNGQLLCSRNHFAAMGWSSAGTLQRAKDDLIEAGFLFETVKGQRPNRASWYAVTWVSLASHPRYDVGAAETFQRSAYMDASPNVDRPAGAFKKITPLVPPGRTASALPVPSERAMGPATVLSEGTKTPVFDASAVPSEGHLLEVFHLRDLPMATCLAWGGGDWVMTDPSIDVHTALGSTGLELLH